MRQFVMTDLHGCNKTFNALLNKVAITKADELYLLGDYFDRGPDSKGVVDTILGLQNTGYNVQCLMGNHELMMLEALRADSRSMHKNWIKNGGDDTLKSFNCTHLRDLPDAYQLFLRELEYFVEVGQFILVHAGLGFSVSNPDPLDLMEASNRHHIVWRRDWYDTIDYHWLGNRYILHGHTPIFEDELADDLANFELNRYLNLDTGCVFPHSGRGVLSCFELNSRELTMVNYTD
jgi:serine/threonine protein phosphatase 1